MPCARLALAVNKGRVPLRMGCDRLVLALGWPPLTNYMQLIADTHVHIYPVHDAAQTFRSACAAQVLSGDGARALCLTERFDCHAFRSLVAAGRAGEFAIVPSAEPDALRVSDGKGGDLFLFAGRQIVTAERLEVLALTVDDVIPDGQPITTVLEHVKKSGGIPVISWAPGKWLFKRDVVVRHVLEQARAGELLLGDTTLRPPVWLEPTLMRYARCKGLGIVAGSDPLPFAGEEVQAGRYGIRAAAGFDPERPVSSLRALLRGPGNGWQLYGRRSSTLEVVSRLRAHHAAK